MNGRMTTESVSHHNRQKTHESLTLDVSLGPFLARPTVQLSSGGGGGEGRWRYLRLLAISERARENNESLFTGVETGEMLDQRQLDETGA